MPHTDSPRRSAAVLVTALCWLLVDFDGYDLIVYGTVVPSLLTEPGWNLTKAGAGTLGSLAFLGMLFGALGAGALADRVGRRRTILGCTIWFSLLTALCAVAQNPGQFGTFRFLAGLGLGGLVPSANALVAEFATPRTRSLASTLMMSGVPIGGTIAALVGIGVIPNVGWRAMFAIALVALVVVVPVAWMRLPESPAWLEAQAAGADGRVEKARATTVLTGSYLVPSILFALATATTLFTWYGLGTWLPQLMRQSGFALGSALTFLVALNVGAVLGSLLTAYAGVRFGPARVAAVAAAVAAGALLLMLTRPGQLGTYAVLVLAGIGTHGTQCLTLAAIADRFPAAVRGSALGFALGVGRIGAVVAPQVGGWLLAMGLGVDENFLVFAGVAAVSCLFLLIVAARSRVDSEEPAAPVAPATSPTTRSTQEATP
ncbi:AAHS family benzoate transporter-like MFS transporter [Knoellia remsis]|uniref:AAHS family benzoate transporter-like MFS transporter n=1 Tax=Knoellia remsis TaxID=407159 RepID=A0A2T0UQF2_9MICO|nr:aromatic acid/H+ symport family MFS transporter [Knoellia remsis]PRY60159.1 AAHS family benzoate transporter-like MFS transporter [Knoellia remsis]